MPKKSKIVQTENGNGVAAKVKKTTRKKPAAKKGGTRKKLATKSGGERKPSRPSDEQIRLRAYFIAERRTQFSLKGDHNSDWLEAKRQLLEEAGLPLN